MGGCRWESCWIWRRESACGGVADFPAAPVVDGRGVPGDVAGHDADELFEVHGAPAVVDAEGGVVHGAGGPPGDELVEIGQERVGDGVGAGGVGDVGPGAELGRGGEGVGAEGFKQVAEVPGGGAGGGGVAQVGARVLLEGAVERFPGMIDGGSEQVQGRFHASQHSERRAKVGAAVGGGFGEVEMAWFRR